MNLRNIFIKASTAIAMTGLTVTAANAIDLTATATATVVNPLIISQTTAMNFGTVSGTSTAGTVTLATNGNRTTAPLNGPETINNDGVAGSYLINGQSGLTINLDIANGTLSEPGGDTMGVSNFTIDIGTLPYTGALPNVGPPGTGEQAFSVGADLAVAASQTPGTYSGTFAITVNYQ